jgi:hypothetical protein
MTYTPINWQNGDTITAEKLNKMDNGWGVSSTQLFSETVTTRAAPFGNAAELSYVSSTRPETLSVTLNGTSYECHLNGDEYVPVGGTFTISADGSLDPWLLITAEAGTFSVAASTAGIVTSSDFDAAVKSIVDVNSIPLLCVSGTTTRAEMTAAESASRLMYFTSGGYFIITGGAADGIIAFMPEQSELHAEFDENDLFNVYYI